MTPNKEQQILETIKQKSNLKQKVFTNTYQVFSDLKKLLTDMAVSYNKQLKDDIEKTVENLINLEYIKQFYEDIDWKKIPDGIIPSAVPTFTNEEKKKKIKYSFLAM